MSASSDSVTMEALPGGRFRASEKTRFGDLSAEGATEEEAIRNLNYLELRRMEDEGLVILPARYRDGSSPRHRSDPFPESYHEEMMAIIKANRREDARREGIVLGPIDATGEEDPLSYAASALGTGVVSDPAIRGGEPTLAGTATPVRAIVELWRGGMAIEDIPVHLSHLALAQVLEALYYYLGHPDEIERHIVANRIPEDWSGRRFDPRTGRVTDRRPMLR